MRPMLFSVLAVWAAVHAGIDARIARAEDEAKPIDKIDRMRLVGPPMLEQTAKEGLYIWVEDGAFHLAAVTNLPFGTKKKLTKTFYVSISSTKPIKTSAQDLDAFKKTGGGEQSLELRVVAGARPEIGKFETEGEVVISGAQLAGSRSPPQIFVGPLARPGASSVRIGRF